VQLKLLFGMESMGRERAINTVATRVDAGMVMLAGRARPEAKL